MVHGPSRLAVFLSLLLVTGFAAAQTIQTVAGGGPLDGTPAVNVSLGYQAYTGGTIAIDNAGNVYFASQAHYRVFKVGPNGGITTIAGNGTPGLAGVGGPATSAQIYPAAVTADTLGNVYVSENGGSVFKISAGILTSVAVSNAALCMAVDSAGNLYFTDGGKVYKLSSGTVSVVAGGFSGATGIALDNSGNIYVAESYTNRIRKISNGIITTVAGSGAQGYSGDGSPATSAALNVPHQVAVDGNGNLYIADYSNNRVRKVSNGIISTVAGTGAPGYSGDGAAATAATLHFPSSVAVAPSGDLYIAEYWNQRIRKVSGGIITTVAGNGLFAADDEGGPPTGAHLQNPRGVTVDRAGSLYIADSGSHRVLKVSNGVIATVAGNGVPGYSGDGGPATNAQLSVPQAVALDAAGNLYITDDGNETIRMVSGGTITTIAGSGRPGYSGDGGPASQAQLQGPQGIAVDSNGDIYFADLFNNVVRKISGGIISTIVGNAYFSGYSGDGGPAIIARLYFPTDVALDGRGNLYIADRGSGRVRKVSDGIITTVAGQIPPSSYSTGDGGPATSASIDPTRIALDPFGNIYISESAPTAPNGQVTGSRIRRVSAGVITTVVGGATSGFSGDGGPPLSALLDQPAGMAIASGSLYIADAGNNRVRQVTGVIVAPPEPSSVTPASGSGVSQTMTFTFTDPRGWQDLDVVNILINNFLDGGNACYIAYSRPSNTLNLLNDAGTALLPGVSLNSPFGALVPIANKQCTVSAAGAPVANGNTLTLTLNLTFSSTFTGNRVVYMAARDIAGNTSGWQPLGTWNVPGSAASALSAPGVTPASGSGSSQTFTFTVTDTKGATDIGVVDILINDSLDARTACYLAYSRPLNLLFPVDDAGMYLVPASTGNSQCNVASTPNMASLNGNTLSLTLPVTFFPHSFSGNRVIYMAARDVTDSQTSGWQAVGSWTVE
ncbi:putative NHL repeat containing protein [Candidatus Sulfopaludibacter sp. SbA4]|nr:putative NHL repeat containing protein [Candidatus Sulfopaludibacter sp. SbA4]